MSLVDLGKRLLEAAKVGQTDEVRTLMSNGAPFTTDWVRLLLYFLLYQNYIIHILLAKVNFCVNCVTSMYYPHGLKLT